MATSYIQRALQEKRCPLKPLANIQHKTVKEGTKLEAKGKSQINCMDWPATRSDNGTTILKKTAPSTILCTGKSSPETDNKREAIPTVATNGSTDNRDVSMCIDTPDKLNDTAPNSTMQTEEQAIPLQQSTKEAMATTAEISQTLIWQLFEQDDAKEAREATLFCVEYEHQIYSYLHNLEREYAADADYMTRQPIINSSMRTILIDWLVLVHLKFNLTQETLFLAVSIMDRYLSLQETAKEQLQLVGVTALLLASKYEEIEPPTLFDIVDVTDSSYSIMEVKVMERKILKLINYNLGGPAPIHFLRRLSKTGRINAEIHTMAKYLLELSLLDYSMIAHLPSKQAASALCLSIQLFQDPLYHWSFALECCSGYSQYELATCLQCQLKLVSMAESLKYQSIQKKYSHSFLLRIAKHPCLSCFPKQW